MKTYDPAFPSKDDTHFFHGVSRREYFAIKAMQSLLTHHAYLGSGAEHISSHAFELADAMIKESDK